MEYPSKKTFIKSIQDLDYLLMLKHAVDEGTAAERASRQSRNLEYSAFLGGVAFWLQNGMRPHGLSREDSLLLRPLAEELIRKGQFQDI